MVSVPLIAAARLACAEFYPLRGYLLTPILQQTSLSILAMSRENVRQLNIGADRHPALHLFLD